jgi:hypothetical protein
MRRPSSKLRTHRLLILLLLVGSLWALVWSLTNAFVPALAREALPTLQTRLEPIGIGLGDVAFSGLRISPWLNGLVLSDLEARLDLNPRDRIQMRSRLDIATLEVRLTHPFSLRGAIQATGLDVRLDPSDRPSQLPFDRISNARLAIGDLPLGDPRQAANAIRDKLKALFFENRAIGEPDAPDIADLLHAHAGTGRPLGPDSFVEALEQRLGRPLKRQKPGPKAPRRDSHTRDLFELPERN